MLCHGLIFGNIIYSVQSGNWNSNTTWNSGSIPLNSDSVVVNSGHEIIMNKDSAQVFFMEVFGSLKWTNTKSLQSKHLLLHNNSILFSSFFMGSINIDSVLTINDGTCTIANLNLNSKNTCTIKGELLFISESGTKKFKNINILSSGKWHNNTNDDPVIVGNICNNGSFKACAGSGCTYHFSGNNILSGDSLISISHIESSGVLTNKGVVEITHSINGNPNIINEGKLQLSLSPLTFHVNEFNASSVGNTVIYNDTSEQIIFKPTNGFYENIELEKGNKRLLNPLLVHQSMKIKSTCVLKSDTFKIAATGSALLQMDSLATLWIGNNENKFSPGFPKEFTSVNLHKSSTVRYMAMGDEIIESAVVYGNLNIDDGSVAQSIKSINNDQLNVKGNLTLEESSLTLQCNHCLLKIDGDWEGVGNLKMNEGLFYFKGNGNNNGIFYPGKSTVIYNGNIDQTIKVGTYYYLNINKNSGKAVLKGNDHILEVAKNLRLQKGTLEMGNETVLINDSIVVEDVLNFTSTKQSKTFKNFIINPSGKVFMKSAASINISGNWSNAGTFSAGKSEVVFSDSLKNQNLNGTTIFYDLSMQKKNTTCFFNAVVSVNHSLNVYSGKINIGENNIQLASAAKINGENNKNYIFGNSGKIQITKTISAGIRDSTGNLGLIFEPFTNLGATNISRSYQSVTINGFSSINRVYEITPSIKSNLNVNVVFQFLANEIHGGEKSKLELWKSEDGSSNWQKVSGTLDTLANCISASNISSFSTWSFIAHENPLPVKWLRFNIKKNENTLSLFWETASEKNTNSFIIQASEDGINFKDIASIDACGNCDYVNRYRYDLSLPEAITYFRIKSADYNSFLDYTAIEVFIPSKISSREKIYFDCNGQEIGKEITADELPNGIYFYKSNNNETGKIIIHR